MQQAAAASLKIIPLASQLTKKNISPCSHDDEEKRFQAVTMLSCCITTAHNKA